MDKENINNRKIASYILSGSTTMAGVCITIIALFRVMKISIETYADEILSINTSLFIISALLSYIALRKENNNRIERIADALFVSGMIIMLLVSFIIVFTSY